MDEKKFRALLYQEQLTHCTIPSPELASEVLNGLLKLLFYQFSNKTYHNQRSFDNAFRNIKQRFFDLVEAIHDDLAVDCESIVNTFYERLPSIRAMLLEDAQAISEGDPAATNTMEVIRTYPGFFAIAAHRIAHELFLLKLPYVPRIFAEYAHSLTGIDIHPGASIGHRFCIDHGTGIVIGETTNIEDDVKIYQGVTLGALSVEKSMAQTKRHPTIKNNVVIYAGATILGGHTIVGQNSIIGGNVWITKSIPPNSTVYYSGLAQKHITNGDS
ncbi:MAG TPA: serine acetyltransferase [Saprospiraceae bacterium]|nr:serine acetyltransferase [Saprospiraceae bacterium]